MDNSYNNSNKTNITVVGLKLEAGDVMHRIIIGLEFPLIVLAMCAVFPMVSRLKPILASLLNGLLHFYNQASSWKALSFCVAVVSHLNNKWQFCHNCFWFTYFCKMAFGRWKMLRFSPSMSSTYSFLISFSSAAESLWCLMLIIKLQKKHSFLA